MNIQTYTIHSFTTTPKGGNPAGVVLDAKGLTSDQMMKISRVLQVSETAFVFPSAVADVKTRFFSPVTEVDLCGHATIALFYLLGTTHCKKLSGTQHLKQETNAGVLPAIVYHQEHKVQKVMMTQQKTRMEPLSLSTSSLADTLGIHERNIDHTFPFQRVSTGLFTLPVCVSSLQVLQAITPNDTRIAQLCQDHEVGSIHVFTFDAIDKDSLYHARNFAPLYGVSEDPVTGTANGAVCSYLQHHGKTTKKNLICEQGDIIGRPGRVHVDLTGEHVQVGGAAVLIRQKTVTL